MTAAFVVKRVEVEDDLNEYIDPLDRQVPYILLENDPYLYLDKTE
jgi:hypothetical protein